MLTIDLSVPFSTCWASAFGHGWIHPASANSGVQVTSSPRMSIDESFAARRRTICSRWPSEAFGSVWNLIV